MVRAMAEARYRYMNQEGTVFGPFWLSQMRDLWKSGRINMRTEVCMEGTRRWEPLEFYPEIFEEDAKMPVLAKMRRAKSDPARLTVWLILLGLALAVGVMQWWGSR